MPGPVSTPSEQTRALSTESFAPALRRYFAKRVPASDVDDLVQDVLVAIHSRQTSAPIDNLEGYLFTIAANALKRHFRNQAARSTAYGSQVHDLDGNLLTPERIVIGRREVESIVVAIQALPERTRAIFVAHRFEEMSYSAIARANGISVSAVEKHIMIALKALAGAIRCP